MRNWKKKTLGGVLAAAMLVSLVPATSALAADNTAKTTDSQSQSVTSCSVNFRVNGYVVQAGTGVGSLGCDSTVAQAAAAVKASFNVPSGKVISGWTLNGAKINTGAKLSEPEFATNSEGLPGGAILDAVLKDAPKPAATFVVTVHANGGTFQSGIDKGHQGDTSFTVTNGSKFVSKLPKVSRLDYVFTGWTYDKAGKSKVIDTDFISANTEVYAQWKAVDVDPGASVNTFTLTVSTNGGVIQNGQFAGQSGDVQNTVGQNEKVLSSVPTVARDGYKFVGWSYDQAGKSVVIANDFISADTHVYAQWTKITTSRVIVHSNGGTFQSGNEQGNVGDDSIEVVDGDTFVDKLPKVSRLDYVFTGWTYDQAGKSKVLDSDFVSANIEVYAQWKAVDVDPGASVNTFTLTVHTNGGTIKGGEFDGQMGDVMTTVGQNEKVVSVAPSVARLDYAFAGWSYDKDGNSKVIDTDFISADTEIWAQWKAVDVDPGASVNTFTLTVSTNGGVIQDGEFAGQAGDVQTTVGQNQTVLSVVPTVTREGYTFKGWSYDKAGKSVVIANDFISADTHVYAQWTKQPVRYTVVYNTNGGNINGEVGDFQIQVKKGETLLDKLPTSDTLKRDGFTLKGWTYAETGTKLDGKAVKKTDKVKGNVYKVVARWDANDVDPGMQVEQFNVVYNTNGGNINGEVGDFQVQVAKGDTILDKLPGADTLVRDGYVLKGWNYAETGTKLDGKSVKASDTATSDIYKLIARWEPTDVDPDMNVEQFNVIYNTNGGNINGEVGDFSVQLGKGETILDKLPDANTLVRDGYKLKGWVYAETGTDKDGKALTKTDVVEGNVYKLVAQWTKVVPAATLTPAQKTENKAENKTDNKTTTSTNKKVDTKKAATKKKLATTGAAVGGVAVVVVLLAAAGFALRKRA
ncbi:InlB B-repeat-containing protein [Bifidobacterium callimiconis]|uniref:Cell wall/surface repeat-containing protein n=1 Tax=Bifidobacterium callimiconis TaxID=2306973 RepID=A0A430FDJ2_9BIFI|nr:InlB B-repeat-containing protein [Bifidobacterium callimiconis]MBT1177829.1 InlB B-repeat-containing protein [Bifidobacterium callimiconis]RSX50944.1 cell wall/surface repeat-containing protein [Bifidobacterium callimiconis]